MPRMRSLCWAGLILAAGTLAQAAVPQSLDQTESDGRYVRLHGGILRVGNRWLERVWRLADGSARTVSLVNKRSRSEPSYLEGAEFMLDLKGALQGEVSAADCRLVGLRSTPSSVTLVYQHRQSPELKVEVVTETYPDRRYQRRWLDVAWSGQGRVVVERIDVEVHRFGWWHVGTPTHSGYGQPVLVGDLYLGLEYPGAEATANYLRHYPGRDANAGLKSKTAVWGVAQDAASVRRAFLDEYLATLVARPWAPFVIYNLLGTGTPDEAKLLRWIPAVGEQARNAGFRIDSFAVDDRWQDDATIWRPSPIQFPRGWAPVAEAARRQGGGLGVWLSLHGHTLETRWGKQRGLEVTKLGDRTSGGRYCIAGKRYRAALEAELENLVRKHAVNYFKMDYNSFGCEDAAHGHPVGRASKDAQIDALLEVVDAVHRAAPETRMALTSGMWLSPWWTPHVDWVWLGGNDMGVVDQVPALSAHDSGITYRDRILYDDFEIKKYVYPFPAVMTHGFWVADVAPYAKFADDAVMTLGRGISKWEILTSPQAMTPSRYQFLGRVIGWGKRNWEILRNTEMILGDPSKGEVYGYAHTGPGAALVFLRNPSLTSRLLEVTPEQLHVLVPPAKAWQAFEVYPAPRPLDPGARLAVEVLGSQTKCIAIVWDTTLAERLRL